MRVTTEIKAGSRLSEAWSFFHSTPPITEYFVEVRVQLTQEERAVLDKYNLWDYGLHKTTFVWSDDYLERHPKLAEDNNTPITHTVRHFVVGFEHCGGIYRWKFSTPGQAASFQLKVEKEIMPLLKQIIEDNMMIGDLPTTKRTLDL